MLLQGLFQLSSHNLTAIVVEKIAKQAAKKPTHHEGLSTR
jgi:hypothetical protein